VIDKVCFDADGPAQKMGDEHLGERWLLMDHADNSDCDDCFLALLRNDGDLHLAFLDVEDRVRENTIWSVLYLAMLRPSPTWARKDFGLNDPISVSRVLKSELSTIAGSLLRHEQF
jgi:hypothetical protein